MRAMSHVVSDLIVDLERSLEQVDQFETIDLRQYDERVVSRTTTLTGARLRILSSLARRSEPILARA
jgi:hypothetical protein